MDNPRKARVAEQHFLNLPGFNAGAYVRAYVEDTTDHEIVPAKRKRPVSVPSPSSSSRSPTASAASSSTSTSTTPMSA